ncbi:MAG: molecular chaperone DnaK [Candidatus Aminicenantes bacterium]|nr:molecular chaperone DnaK [Candidatus Aminicenantes bacterium]
MKSRVIGIDLGTTFSCIAHLTDEGPKVIPNLDGMPTTPSTVCFTSSGEILVGNLASRQALSNPEKTIYAVKRLIGRKFKSAEVEEARSRMAYGLTEAANGDVLIRVDERSITPQEASAHILDYLRRCAEAYFGGSVNECVITVPAHFDDHQRQATKDAARIARLDVLRVINEPTAASLAYGLDRNPDGLIAVYDLGGGTFDISLLEISGGVFHVLATAGDDYLGGEDFDQRIIVRLISDFQSKFGVDLGSNPYSLQRLKEAAERAKRDLSFTQETEINLPFITSDPSGSKHLQTTINRATLEEWTRDLVDRTLPLMDKVLRESGFTPGQVNDILLVGGQTRMPLVRKRVGEFFGKAPNTQINPDESVALGAAIQSGILEGAMKDIVLLLDVTSMPMGIEVENDGFEKIIDKNMTIPCRKTKSFTTIENNQRRVRIHVLQGESPKASENTSLAMFDLIGIMDASAGIPQIDVTFEINADGMVKVSARDVVSGREQKIVVQSSSGLSEQQIEGIMLQEKQRTAAKSIP